MVWGSCYSLNDAPAMHPRKALPYLTAFFRGTIAALVLLALTVV